MKFLKFFTSFILFLIILSCVSNNDKDCIICNDSNLSFRTNFQQEEKQLVLIEKGSAEYNTLKHYINNLDKLDQKENLNTYPFYAITGENLKILINPNRIDIDYKNANNERIKLSKEISTDEFLNFNYLSQTGMEIFDFGNIYGKGNFRKAKYIECGIFRQEIDYKYKVGKWKFWDLKRNLIAEGEFEIDSALAIGRGGCDYMVKMSKVKGDKWIFYDENGKEIKGTIEQIYNIENAKY
ncbi:hypothetical protein [Zunongwangia atlantica]|uniref:Lipoprotein n=1 Tax=Zunongwangia atlantica 22II14-10F7 TaxID=1185767 RepID=A0A1Y1SXH8_9FLAO|nr:hypothetical protein [Zunongwangia atlantica]ORL43471.1 hypothetical protein IIF7_20646 [Zunongwangia atlantica 22II14-10F7]